MGCSIQFVRLADFAADIDVLDLSADGYSLDRDGYFPVAAPIGAKSVHEVITLKLQGTSKDDLAAMTQEIDEKIKQVQWWIDAPDVERYQVWLRVQLENETYPRQAQILNITPPDKLRVFVPEEINNNYIGAYSLGIERTPFWEDPYPYPTTASKSSIGTIGGIVQLDEIINGDVPARLPKFAIGPNGGSNQTDYYIGFRTNRLGNPANFASVWSCKDGYLFTFSSDTVTASESSAYSGTMAVCSFVYSPSALQWRVSWFLSSVTANPNDQRGEYQVLLRARMSDNTSVARVRMYYSFGLATGSPTMAEPINPTYRSRVVIDGSKIVTTNWALFELGTISIPSSRVENGTSLENFAVALDAERISGSGNLHLDCLILIPSSEGFAHVASDRVQFSSGGYINIYQYADDVKYSLGQDGVIVGVVKQGMINWGLPANGVKPYVIIASQISTSGSMISNKGDIATISYSYIPRWRTLRGNVT